MSLILLRSILNLRKSKQPFGYHLNNSCHVKEEGSYWWEEPSSQTESMEKADCISAEVDNFKEAFENYVEVCDVLKVKSSLVSLKRKSFKITRLSFNIYDITNLNMILQGFLDLINFFIDSVWEEGSSHQ